MAEDDLIESQNTQTQTQKSEIYWSQSTPSSLPTIWGRLYSTNVSINGKRIWKNAENRSPEYYDLTSPEFSFGRSINCSFVVKKDIFRDDFIKNVSKEHFIISRDMTEVLSPIILEDRSYNGTFINGVKVGKGNSQVIDDNDEIAISHPMIKVFVLKDLLKNDQDAVPLKVSEKYYISRTLGRGACGVVKLVYEKTTCAKRAMKIVKKNSLSGGHVINNNCNDPDKIKNEINIMKSLQHPLIVATEEVFESKDAVYIILELMEGGELFDRILKHGYLSEATTKFMFRQIVLAVKYLHSQGITHRDLKPENVLLESKDDETLVKLSDFGLSKYVGEDSFMKTMCGTPIYLAPEVLHAKGTQAYGPEVDIWSLGVIFFVCVSGYLPFSPEYSALPLEAQIARGAFRYSAAHWRHVGAAAKHLMRRMLTVDVARRITLQQILQHPWMQDIGVITKVDRLISQALQRDSFTQQTFSSNDSDETDTSVILLNSKRALSDAYNSCEPMPKKLKVAFSGKNTSDNIDSGVGTTLTSNC